ncbi:hypothetical protein K488DRAFT_85708 [Vararia minispora EC-137]|uniref:Uncharacterized protein n=1 Tax=Vararia minispora EC-137 TaxID=1314806 RepID=A0ACB8QLP3_9AGAM|nr:hypothetical protein K488DRAFT_85708 [Vararia minispora EC-137]
MHTNTPLFDLMHDDFEPEMPSPVDSQAPFELPAASRVNIPALLQLQTQSLPPSFSPSPATHLRASTEPRINSDPVTSSENTTVVPNKTEPVIVGDGAANDKLIKPAITNSAKNMWFRERCQQAGVASLPRSVHDSYDQLPDDEKMAKRDARVARTGGAVLGKSNTQAPSVVVWGRRSRLYELV